MIYIVSYVVPGEEDLGTIQNEEKRPEGGDQVNLGGRLFEVIEVKELVPCRGDFCYLHVSCKPLTE